LARFLVGHPIGSMAVIWERKGIAKMHQCRRNGPDGSYNRPNQNSFGIRNRILDQRRRNVKLDRLIANRINHRCSFDYW
jgi:hypothetical protein